MIDTLEIWHLPNQRYISLKFLVKYVLKKDIQLNNHDSIEDAIAVINF
jgi:PAB-dependent poly(A)-specific ribonuclease subunit 2